jgi:putative ABC transport system ATP-binding protein
MLELRNIRKCYPLGGTTVYALNGIDLEVVKNEFTAIMGASGSGKSTLMNIIGCLDTPTEGYFSLNGHEICHMDDDELAAIRNEQLGFVFQSFNLLPRLNALKNVALPLMYSRVGYHDRLERAAEILDMVGLVHRANHKPTELSGGEMQRVAIARALVNNPEIILADEPTGNLDSTTSKEIMELFSQLHQQGQTLIMVTHEDNIAAYAQRVILIRDGRIVDDSRK